MNTVVLGNGNDTVVAGNGLCTVVVGNGNDQVFLGGCYNTVSGGNGNDTVVGGQGYASVSLGSGRDLIELSGGHNDVTTGKGNDIVVLSGGGDNVVRCGGGTNTVVLSGWDNRVETGPSAGMNFIYGGCGMDTFVLGGPAGGKDWIASMSLGNGDVLDVRQALAATRWDGRLADLGAYLHVTQAGQDSLISVSDAGQRSSCIADLANCRVTLGELISHNALQL